MKKIAKAIVSMGVVLAFAGCSWQIPQTVSVKTNADYSFSLGNFTNDLGDSMDTTSMMGDAGEGNANIQTLDYFPGKSNKNVQHYLLEVNVLEKNFTEEGSALATAVSNLAEGASIDLGSALGSTYDHIDEKTIGLNFNPTTLLSEMKKSFGNDLGDKITFHSVPMYLYCEVTEGVTANATLKIFYGSTPENENDSIEKRNVSSWTNFETILNNAPLTNKPKPVYQKEGETIITNLNDYLPCVFEQPKQIEGLLNANDPLILEDDQLCISYAISNIDGTIPKSVAENGITLKLYAVIDLPVEFDVSSTADVKLDVSKMSGDSDSSSSSSSESSSSGDSEFSKYLNVMDSVSINYVVYQLPIYAANGMQLWVDLIGDGLNYDKGSDIVFVDKNKTITEADKSTITLKTATIQKMKDTANFKPNFVLFLKRGSVFSLPREKMIDMNLEMSFKTDGTIQVK